MSMYNMVCGQNPLAGVLLSIIGFNFKTAHEDIPRLRDLYVTRDEAPRIVIFTRTGGSNRAGHDLSVLTKNPNYHSDHDDSYDETYAHFEFNVPEKYRALLTELNALCVGCSAMWTPGQKFNAAIAKLSDFTEKLPYDEPAVEATDPSEETQKRLPQVIDEIIKHLIEDDLLPKEILEGSTSS